MQTGNIPDNLITDAKEYLPTYSVTIINFQQDELIASCLAALEQQTFSPKSVFIIDNSGLLSEIVSEFDTIKLVQTGKNLGYAGGSNCALSLCRSKYILIMNPDALLEPDYAARLISYMEKHPETASVSGLLLHYDFANHKPTKFVDSAGIEASRSGKFWDRGQGIEWKGQYKTSAVFGVSGAAALYRIDALLAVAIEGEIFDEDMFVYKEDIDIAWRLKSLGWNSVIVVEAVGYHGRAAGGSEKGLMAHLMTRNRHSKKTRRFSFRNQILLLIKNGNRKDLNLGRTLLRQIIVFLYICFFEPSVLIIIPELLRVLPKILIKRKKIKQLVYSLKS